MYLMIDNYDSFVYNLKAYFEELGKEIAVIRCDKITLEEIEDMQPSGIILSPGPKRPQDATLCIDIVEKFQEKIPILGVCLGHQVLGLCAGLPTKFNVTRYHSLVVNKDTISNNYRIDATTADGVVMGISHKTLPLYGVQFHPEAVCTEYGHALLNNFCKIAEQRG